LRNHEARVSTGLKSETKSYKEPASTGKDQDFVVSAFIDEGFPQKQTIPRYDAFLLKARLRIRKAFVGTLTR